MPFDKIVIHQRSRIGDDGIWPRLKVLAGEYQVPFGAGASDP